MEIIFASNNAHKLEEIRKIWSDLPINIHSMADAGLKLDIEENGQSFEENAFIKARAVMQHTGKAALADDSGLEVDALDGAPGIYSARFAGENASDTQNNQLLLQKLGVTPYEKRSARFRCVLALVTPEGEELHWDGTCEGIIGFETAGNTGFGYDPLFIVLEYEKTMAELGPEIKNKISHRARALEQAHYFFMNWLCGGQCK